MGSAQRFVLPSPNAQPSLTHPFLRHPMPRRRASAPLRRLLWRRSKCTPTPNQHLPSALRTATLLCLSPPTLENQWAGSAKPPLSNSTWRVSFLDEERASRRPHERIYPERLTTSHCAPPPIPFHLPSSRSLQAQRSTRRLRLHAWHVRP